MSDDHQHHDCKASNIVDIEHWIERVRSDPLAYLERQATEVLLTAVSLAPSYNRKIFLKGGVLMGIRYRSPRETADLDFTTSLDPDPAEIEHIVSELDTALQRAAVRLGYPDLVCRVQTIKKRPRPKLFRDASFPALELKVAYALRGSPQEERFKAGSCPTVLDLDISFNEPVDGVQIVRLGDDGVEIPVYSLTDLIAEKLRALLQQESRNRYRRQDVYDLALLIEQTQFNAGEKRHLLKVFLEKSHSRGIAPDQSSVSSPEVVGRARSEWDTLGLELGELPDFDERFEVVDRFYRSLPWD
jgi:predicted nucleotidyltransferase component of viral defense system